MHSLKMRALHGHRPVSVSMHASSGALESCETTDHSHCSCRQGSDEEEAAITREYHLPMPQGRAVAQL